LKKTHFIIIFLITSLVTLVLGKFYFTVLLVFLFILLGGIIFLPQIIISKRIKLILTLILIIAITLSLIRIYFTQHLTTITDLDYYNGQEVIAWGDIVDEPDIRHDKVLYTVSVKKILSEQDVIHPVSGKLLITANRFPVYSYGDNLKITGKLQEPVEFESFSYKNYLARHGIYSVMYQSEVTLIKNKTEYFSFLGIIFKIKHYYLSLINKLYAEPYSSLMAGILLGSRSSISEQLLYNFNITGLTHIIAISGFNITIIIMFIGLLLGAFPRSLKFILTIFCIIIFTIMTGASAAVVRAAVMGVLGLIALHNGRQNNILITILFSAVMISFWNPYILWFDIGFHLSFLAVLGLIYVAPLIEKFFIKIPNVFEIRNILIMTISAQITAIPLILLHFHRLSIIAPLANLLVIPVIPLLMLLGFISLILFSIFSLLGLLTGYYSELLLKYIVFIINNLGKLPLASIEINFISSYMVVIYYIILIFIVFVPKKALCNYLNHKKFFATL